MQAYTISFTLLEPCSSVSIDVYDPTTTPKQKVATACSCQPYSVGAHQLVWYGNDDFGAALPLQSWEARVQSGNPIATWVTVIGNTSTYPTGSTHMQGIGGIADICCVDTRGFYLRQYNEAGENQNSFLVANPNVTQISGAIMGVPVGLTGYEGTAICYDVATGLIFVAMTGVNGGGPTQSIIGTYKPDETVGQTFSGPAQVAGFNNGQNNSGKLLIIGADATFAANSISVGQGLLCMAQTTQGKIKVVGSTTGSAAAYPDLTLANVAHVAWSKSGNTLWASTVKDLYGYTQSGGNSWVQSYQQIGTGFQTITGLAVDPVTGNLAVQRGGTGAGSQMVTMYTADSTTSLGSFGVSDAYKTDPTVADNKWMNTGGGLNYQPDGKLWVGDSGGNRFLLFDLAVSTTVAVNTVMTTGAYNVSADPNQPNRIFTTPMKEFAMDWTQTPPKWTYAKNWGYGLGATVGGNDGLANIWSTGGHTYAKLLRNLDVNCDLVELTSTGLRIIGTYVSVFVSVPATTYTTIIQTLSNGDVIAPNQANPVVISKASFTGLDGSNNPTWGAWSSVVSIPATPTTIPYGVSSNNVGGIPIPVCANGDIITAKTAPGSSLPDNAYTLGALTPSSGKYRWQNAQYRGFQPLIQDCRMPYDVNAAELGGGIAWCPGFVVINGRGEGWESSEANQNLLFSDAGLAICQTGTRLYQYAYNFVATSDKPGNGYSLVLIDPGITGVRFLVYCSENGTQGPQVLKYSNLQTLQVTTQTITPNAVAAPVTISALGSIPATPGFDCETFRDNFNGANTGLGYNTNGWTDPQTAYQRNTNYVQQLLFGSGQGNAGGPMLTRAKTCLNSIQELTTPQILWQNATWLASGAGQSIGFWSVLSRIQPSDPGGFPLHAKAYIGYWQFQCYNGVANVNDNPGSILVGIAILNWDGSINQLWADYFAVGDYRILDNPGGSYAVRLLTVGTSPTKLIAQFVNALTGEVLLTSPTKFDWTPELQQNGQLGLVCGSHGNPASLYRSGAGIPLPKPAA